MENGKKKQGEMYVCVCIQGERGETAFTTWAVQAVWFGLVCQTGSKSVFEGEAQSVLVHVYPSRQSSPVKEEMHTAENTYNKNKIVRTSSEFPI